MFFKYLMKKLGSREKKVQFFSKYDNFFPKNRKKAILVVKRNTEFSGNLRVCADVLLNSNRHKVYVYKDGPMPIALERAIKAQGIEVLKHNSWRSFYHLFTSGLMVFSHVPRDAHISIRNKKRVIVGLWHGVAFKNIESQIVSVTPEKLALIEKNAALYDLMTASSQKDKKYLAKSFMVNESIIKVTGLPRYDLLKRTYPLDAFLAAQKKRIDQFKANRTLVLYAPTFRENCESHLNQISDSEWVMLNSLMIDRNALLGVRPHPYDIKQPPKIFASLNNLMWLNHDVFTETNLVLQYSDVLVVDFSSIWIDYLLLDRPIIGFAKDFEHYRDTERGFAYDFSDTFPSVFVNNIIDLTTNLDKLFINDLEKQDYTRAKKMFHEYNLSTDFSKNLEQVMNPHLSN